MKKYNLIVPIAGKGTRIQSIGSLPKPMLINSGKSILEWSMDSIDYSECNLVFAVRKEHVLNYAIDEWLKQKFGEEIQIIQVGDTSGACETVCKTIDYVDDELPLIIYCSDTYFEPKYKPLDKDFETEGLILTFKANSPNYSYSKLDEQGLIIETREKEVISDLASVGVYCFQSTDYFYGLANEYIKNCIHRGIESHICPLYNRILNAKTKSINKIHIMGTAEEFKFFQNVSSKYLVPNRSFALCCDHSGHVVKEAIMTVLENLKVPYIDFGCYSEKDCDYGLYVKMTADHVLQNKNFFGIGVCRSGQGINIMANKIPGIRAALVQDGYHAAHAIWHNAANFFSISAKDFPDYLDYIVEVLLKETFDGGRHQNRIMNCE